LIPAELGGSPEQVLRVPCSPGLIAQMHVDRGVMKLMKIDDMSLSSRPADETGMGLSPECIEKVPREGHVAQR